MVMVIALLLVAVSAASAQRPRVAAPADQSVLQRISPDSLRGHLSFLASDLLEGRDTPSRGLDLAAEYIAAQFRRAGLEPAGDAGFFQTANWRIQEAPIEGRSLTIGAGGKSWRVAPGDLAFQAAAPVSVAADTVVKMAPGGAAPEAGSLMGKVVLAQLPELAGVPREQAAPLFRARNELIAGLRAAGPRLILFLQPRASLFTRMPPARLVDPELPPAPRPPSGAPVVTVVNTDLAAWFGELPAGESAGTVTLTLPPLTERPVRLHNVAGVLRGSDPALKNTCVIVSAHYDHLGVAPDGGEDRIFNGANDDGSGTVSVIELAGALAARKPAPRRSILFLTFFGEEKGLLGSRYYGRHPVFPIEKTVAHVNLEQVGRTDDTEGAQVNAASLTGFDFSDVGPILAEAGARIGIRIFKHPRNSDAFFGRSDNQALADLGVPAHTLCVAYVYPDYHGLADHWEKVDYANMAQVNRAVALGLLALAERREEPAWNPMNPRAESYRQAWEKRRKR